jgi:hypothetical protein
MAKRDVLRKKQKLPHPDPGFDGFADPLKGLFSLNKTYTAL